MKHFYVMWIGSRFPNGCVANYKYTIVDAACEYDAKIIVHNELNVPIDDIELVSEL